MNIKTLILGLVFLCCWTAPAVLVAVQTNKMAHWLFVFGWTAFAIVIMVAMAVMRMSKGRRNGSNEQA